MARFFEPEIKEKDLRSDVQKYAQDWLVNLLKETPQFPAEQVAGMSPAEQLAQQMLMSWAGTEPEGLGTLRDYAGGENILDRPEIQGIINEVLQRGNEMAQRLGRGLQLRGAGTSSGAQEALGRSTTETQQALLATLAPYLQSAETRRLGAAQALAGLSESGKLNRLNALSTTGSLPRQLEQLANSAEFNRAMNQLMFPYTTQAEAAKAAATAPRDVMVYTKGSTWSQIAPAVGAIIGGIFGGGQGAMMGKQMGEETGAMGSQGYSYNLQGGGGGYGQTTGAQQSGGGQQPGLGNWSMFGDSLGSLFGGGQANAAGDWQQNTEAYWNRGYGAYGF
ncbi:MAG: hypothetical protein OEV33_00060 [Armatimonadota bacterium]|nr:hypothetical protein [Armatimonadota bacterium]